jgi:hypothetical protein
MKRATEGQDAKIQQWLKEDYPKIEKRAGKEGAVIRWGDETGLSNQADDGRSFALKGQPPDDPAGRQAPRHRHDFVDRQSRRGQVHDL